MAAKDDIVNNDNSDDENNEDDSDGNNDDDQHVTRESAVGWENGECKWNWKMEHGTTWNLETPVKES